MNAASEVARNKEALRQLYAGRFAPQAWRDEADHGFIGTSLIERSIALLAPQLGGELLDVGCGQQPYRGYLSHLTRIRACDYDARRGDVDFSCPADCLPLPEASLDSILCTEVLEHVPDPLAVWREFHRVLRPGGRVLLSTPMYWPSHEQPYDFYRYPEYGLRYLVEKSAFTIEALLPRGGVWALFGQVTLQVMPQYFRFRWQRVAWNRSLLKLDRWRCNAQITLGWTVLARKNNDPIPGSGESGV